MFPLKLYDYLAFSCSKGNDAKPVAVVRLNIVVVGNTWLIS
jgi:hypothetical protein